VSAFIGALLEEVQRERYDFLLPMTEGTVLPISAHRDKFLPRVRLPLPSHASILKVFNKAETISLAIERGIPTPQTWLVDDLRELPALARRLTYPVVVKSRMSSYWRGDHMVMGGGAHYAVGPDQLLEHYHRIHAEIPFPLIQAYVPGQGYGIFLLFDKGKPKRVFAHERIRDVRPTGSGSALRRSVAPDPTLTAYAVSLLEAVQWHGVAMVEFRWDRGRSDPVLMEINGRFWNSLPLAIAAGVDFPHLLLAMEDGGLSDDAPFYQVGLLCRWFLGDCRHLFEVFRGAPAGWPLAFPGRWQTLLSFVKSFQRETFYDTFRGEDPLPELIEWLHLLFASIPRRVKSGTKWVVHSAKPV
jgi:predicted ATP-grasp superfamily ATP-dependent carboligase